ncbi:hypothetical protein [Planotetraspora kaengkrachanensis]|uniref:hypothetical protein n=1 Tax=Planotetraspora kaengkrachanensis TaxID=575193 RepID=UPI001941E4EE|nr:hypothetical protein [Planotetraspora kaengkrachanensis]
MISRKSSSAFGSRTGRVLISAVALAACGAFGFSGVAAASASTTMTDPHVAGGPWLDGDDISNLPTAFTGNGTSSLLLLVSANNGVPFVRDPRTGWANLRNVANSAGGYVQNITVGQLTTGATGPQIARITARTAGGIFKTDCTIDAVPIPTSGPILGCSPWAPLPVMG